MQDGSENNGMNSDSGTNQAAPPSTQPGAPGPAGTPGRCHVHAVGSMLNPLAFDELAGGGEDVWIACNGQVYRLRRTKLEKLILTK